MSGANPGFVRGVDELDGDENQRLLSLNLPNELHPPMVHARAMPEEVWAGEHLGHMCQAMDQLIGMSRGDVTQLLHGEPDDALAAGDAARKHEPRRNDAGDDGWGRRAHPAKLRRV